MEGQPQERGKGKEEVKEETERKETKTAYRMITELVGVLPPGHGTGRNFPHNHYCHFSQLLN